MHETNRARKRIATGLDTVKKKKGSVENSRKSIERLCTRRLGIRE